MIKHLKKLIVFLEHLDQLEEEELLKIIKFLKKIPGVKFLMKGMIKC